MPFQVNYDAVTDCAVTTLTGEVFEDYDEAKRWLLRPEPSHGKNV